MNRKVVLSKTAEKQLNKLLDYLESEWSTKVKLKFYPNSRTHYKLSLMIPWHFLNLKSEKVYTNLLLPNKLRSITHLTNYKFLF